MLKNLIKISNDHQLFNHTIPMLYADYLKEFLQAHILRNSEIYINISSVKLMYYEKKSYCCILLCEILKIHCIIAPQIEEKTYW